MGLFQRRLQLQLLLILLAAVSVATLSVLLIWDSIANAEKVVISDMSRQLTSAVSELGRQYSFRVTSDSAWHSLPLASQDVSLRAISLVVLRPYPGVEGGYYADSELVGYSFPTHDNPEAKTDVPAAERSVIEEVTRRALAVGKAEQLLRGASELVLIQAAKAPQQEVVAWSMERRSRQGSGGSRRALLVALVIAALLSVGGTLKMGIGLRRGVAQIQDGLAALEKDFGHSLPEGNDELGEIERSINRMARIRGRLEEELRRDDRLRAIGRTVAGIAHEIRNPLNGIRLSMQLLDQRLRRGAIQSDDLALVIEEVDRMEALLSDLLAFRETKKAVSTDQEIIPVIERCVQLVQPANGGLKKHVVVEVQGRNLRAYFDSQRLTQALLNLLLNALEASGIEGTVRVTVLSGNETVAVEVHDAGPGLSPEQQQHLFEAFYTTKPTGTGLGLAVSRELAEEMGGTLKYKDEQPGATFVLELPAVRNA
jgi:signal transduction histidine kinase